MVCINLEAFLKQEQVCSSLKDQIGVFGNFCLDFFDQFPEKYLKYLFTAGTKIYSTPLRDYLFLKRVQYIHSVTEVRPTIVFHFIHIHQISNFSIRFEYEIRRGSENTLEKRQHCYNRCWY